MDGVNETAASVLGFLSLGPMTGWDLYRLADISVSNFWSMTRSQVYRELQALEERGLVEGDSPGARNARRYQLTEAGSQALQAWLLEPPGAGSSRIPFLVKLFFAHHLSDDEVERMAAAARSAHEEKLARYEEVVALADGLSPFAGATARYGIAVERAVLAWFDEAPWKSRS